MMQWSNLVLGNNIQLVSGKDEFKACQVLLLFHKSVLGSLFIFSPPSYPVHHYLQSPNSVLVAVMVF